MSETGAKEKMPDTTAAFAAILDDAAGRYKDSTGEKLGDFMNPPMRSVQDLISQLDLQNERFQQFRAKRHSIFSAVSTALKPVELVGDIIAGGAAEIFPPTQHIFSSVMYLISAAHDVSSAYDSIVALLEQLKDFTNRLNVYIKHKLSDALRAKLVEILAALFNVLVLATKEVQQGRFRAYFKRLFGSDSPVQPALDNLQALTLAEQRQVAADTYDGVLEINTRTERFEDVLNQVNENVLSLRTENLERANLSYQDRLRELLQPSPFPEDFYSAFTKSRIENTGDWLLEDEGLKVWLRGETQYLWMYGNHGTGKSFLVTRLLSWCNEQAMRVGYFFFRDNNPETRSVLQGLRDVAYQLSENDAFYAKQLMRTTHRSDELRTVASAYRKLFVEPFETDNRGRMLYVFLDGIDEADQEELDQFLALIGPDDDLGEARTKVQFAMVGRTHLSEAVTSALDPVAQGDIFTTVQITTARNADDVRTYLVSSIINSRIMRRTSNDFVNEVIRAMEEQVDGLFILAKLMIAEVNRRRRPNSILESVRTFPKETEAMLQQTLANISSTLTLEEAADLNEMLRWVACAEETLSLAQIEEALTLRFGDPPFRLEEMLRGPYGCFFELEREDGLTTDDLNKEYERKRRRTPDVSPNRDPRQRRLTSGTASPPARVSSSRGRLSSSWNSSPGGLRSPTPLRNSPPVASSPTFRGSPPIFGSPPFRGSPPVRYTNPFRNSSPALHISPVSSSDMSDWDAEIEYGSNKHTTFVTFFHSSVRQFFRNYEMPPISSFAPNPVVDFDIRKARLHTLQTCLRIFNDKKWYEELEPNQQKTSMKQYAAWYWQEHLAAVDINMMSIKDKHDIGMHIYKMLTDETVVLDWTIQYEENNEGLEVLNDRSITAIRQWMGDAGVLESLDPEARAWAEKAMTKYAGIAETIGRVWAKAWLSSDRFEHYVPTLFCFEIVQSLAFVDSGDTWSSSKMHASDMPAEQRITKALEWANFPMTARSHRRIGSTYLTQGLHERALAHYEKALELDDNGVQTLGRIAYCLYMDGRYDQALQKALTCASMEEGNIENGVLDGAELARSKWRLYKDHFLIAQCYYKTFRVDCSLEYYRKAIDSAAAAKLDTKEDFAAEAAYLQVLAAENRHGEMMDKLREMASQLVEATTDQNQNQNRLVEFLLAQYNHTLVLDWIPKAACKAQAADFEFFLDVAEQAVDAARATLDHLKALYLRLSMGSAYAYHRDTDEAIAVFEQISLLESRARGNIPTRQGRAMSFQLLAGLYKTQVWHAGLGTPDADQWIARLEHIQQKQDVQQTVDMPSSIMGSDVNAAAIYLAVFYRHLGRAAQSRALLQRLVLESLELLSDEEPQNDEFALQNLLRLLVAADDADNARALAQSMRKPNPRMAPPGTPADSPLKHRDEPKLPDIQATNRSCAQCLLVVSLSDEFVICKRCVEPYCMECLEKVIKRPDNATADHREDVLCRNDHEWFTVGTMDRVLHRGEILVENREVRGLGEWKNGLQKWWSEFKVE
jgi:tetratricopeptide (TPR) repeat protein